MHLRRELPLLSVTAVALAAVGLVAAGHWHPGLVLFGTALLGAACMRACLPEPRLGLLVVRGRTFDTLWLAVLGATLIVLTQSLIGTG